jgi:L-lactate utilization protein LutB
MDWTNLATDAVIAKTVTALKARGFVVFVVNNRDEAKKKVIELMPKGAEVMRANSITLDQTGITEYTRSLNCVSLKDELVAEKESNNYIRDDAWKRALAPQYGIGSVQAVTEDGQVVIASSSGIQQAFYIYGAEKVIWVVGIQKIVKTLDQAIQRIFDYVLPLVVDEARNFAGTGEIDVSKLLIVRKEPIPKRTTLIFVKENVGL